MAQWAASPLVQCFLEANHAMQDEPRIGQRVGASAVDLQCGAKERQRGLKPPALIVEHAKKMQRIEIVGIALQSRRVKRFRPAKLALRVGMPGAADHAR